MPASSQGHGTSGSGGGGSVGTVPDGFEVVELAGTMAAAKTTSVSYTPTGGKKIIATTWQVTLANGYVVGPSDVPNSSPESAYYQLAYNTSANAFEALNCGALVQGRPYLASITLSSP